MVSKTYGNIVRFILKPLSFRTTNLELPRSDWKREIEREVAKKIIFTAVLVLTKRRITNNNKLGNSSQLNRGNYFIVIRTKWFHNVVFVTMLVLLTMSKQPRERAIFSLDSVLLDQLLRGWINGSTEAESNETSSLGYMKIYNPTFKNGRGGFQQQWYRWVSEKPRHLVVTKFVTVVTKVRWASEKPRHLQPFNETNSEGKRTLINNVNNCYVRTSPSYAITS